MKLDPFIDPIFYKYFSESPLVHVDVGAGGGGLKANWHCARKFLKLIAFEPDFQRYNELEKNKKQNELYINSALSNEKTKTNFVITKCPANNSLFEPNTEFLQKYFFRSDFQIVGQGTIAVDTLDNQLEKHLMTDVDFIKLDTQGSELSILNGGMKALKNTLGLDIEVIFNNVYKGAPLFAVVDQFIREQGFVLFDINQNYWKRIKGAELGRPKGQIIGGDALYFRDPKTFSDKNKVLKAISISLIYGYFDYALDLVNDLGFSSQELSIMRRKINKYVYLNGKIPHFRGRKNIAMLFHKLYNSFNTHYLMATPIIRSLGNF